MTNTSLARVHCDVKRSLFSRGTKVSVTAELSFSEDEKAQAISKTRFIHTLFRDRDGFFSKYVDVKDEKSYLVDVRGRSLDSFRNVGDFLAAKSLPEGHEELLFARLLLAEPKESESEETSSEQAISYSVSTQFEDFQGEHIRFRKEAQSSPILGEIFSEISPHLLSRFIPARIDELRFGLEFYRTSFFGIQWGSVPSVYRRLYLTIQDASLKIFAEDTISRGKSFEPFYEERLMRILANSLSEAGITNDFESLLAEGLARISYK